jgi:opine dehydrogenase
MHRRPVKPYLLKRCEWQRYGVSVQAMDSIIRLACIIHRTDYWRCGRTLDKLGIDQLSVGELTQYAMEGEL